MRQTVFDLSDVHDDFGRKARDAMNWRVAMVLCSVLQGLWPALGDRAAKTHGAELNLFFGAFAGIVIGMPLLHGRWSETYEKVSRGSATLATLSGFMAAIAFILYLRAFEGAGKENAKPLVAVVCGLAPIVTVLALGCFGEHLRPGIGIACALMPILLYFAIMW